MSRRCMTQPVTWWGELVLKRLSERRQDRISDALVRRLKISSTLGCALMLSLLYLFVQSINATAAGYRSLLGWAAEEGTMSPPAT